MGKFYGITKGNKHSYNNFGLKIISRELNPPSKKKIKETIPFMHGSYDFSSLYGENVYEERKIKYIFDFRYRNKLEFISKKIAIANWLTSGSKEPLYDDLIPGYYFIAECEDSIDFSEGYVDCEVTVTFTAYPFKIRTYEEGNIPWDDFIFDLDTLQKTKFNVQGSKDIKLYNESAKSITPIIVSDSEMQILKDRATYIVPKGEIKDYRLNLDIGENKLTINGNGNIEFKFRRELL